LQNHIASGTHCILGRILGQRMIAVRVTGAWVAVF